MPILSFEVQEKNVVRLIHGLLFLPLTRSVPVQLSGFKDRVDIAAENIYFNEEPDSKSPISGTDQVLFFQFQAVQ
jgi:hypothetical protein